LSKEFSNEGICTASKKYQDIKLSELEALKNEIPSSEYDKKKTKITEKSCLCVGLVNASYLENDIKIKGQEQGVVICPGPNLAYFDKEVSLSEMVKHIYGNASVMGKMDRPNMFVNELKMYVDYLKNEIEEISTVITAAQIKKWQSFKNNLIDGITYYENLFANITAFKKGYESTKNKLQTYKNDILEIEIPQLEVV